MQFGKDRSRPVTYTEFTQLLHVSWCRTRYAFTPGSNQYHQTGLLQVKENWKRSEFDWSGKVQNYLESQGKVGSCTFLGRKCASDWTNTWHFANFKQHAKCLGEKKVKHLGIKSTEMVKSACQDNLCWCCKLLCAFGTEMCGGILVEECCVIDWKSQGIWFWQNSRDPVQSCYCT